MSLNSFEFTYVQHENSLTSVAKEHVEKGFCAFCTLNGDQTHVEESLPVAKPGTQRRKANLMAAPDYLEGKKKEEPIPSKPDSRLLKMTARPELFPSGRLPFCDFVQERPVPPPVEPRLTLRRESDLLISGSKNDFRGLKRQSQSPPMLERPPPLISQQKPPLVKMNLTVKANEGIDMNIAPSVILASPEDLSTQTKRSRFDVYEEEETKVKIEAGDEGQQVQQQFSDNVSKHITLPMPPMPPLTSSTSRVRTVLLQPRTPAHQLVPPSSD